MEQTLLKSNWAENLKRQLKPTKEEIDALKLDYLLEEIKSYEFYDQQRGKNYNPAT